MAFLFEVPGDGEGAGVKAFLGHCRRSSMMRSRTATGVERALVRGVGIGGRWRRGVGARVSPFRLRQHHLPTAGARAPQAEIFRIFDDTLAPSSTGTGHGPDDMVAAGA